jgi:CheY-like chemotaxis protein
MARFGLQVSYSLTLTATKERAVSHKRLLLVDDEPSIRVVLGAVLADAGYIVDVAEDGIAALRKLEPAPPDLVITDLRMPNMNGFELLSALRARFPELPTIAISGEFLTADVNGSSIADAFFQKGSYAIPDLLAKVKELLTTPRRRSLEKSTLWSPIGDAPVMLTCTNCLQTFPIDACDGQPKRMPCIHCGADLEIRLVAIGMTPGCG